MAVSLHGVEFAGFAVSIGLVALFAVIASQRPHGERQSVEEWGLGGRKFGTLVTWFLVGGDFYTAYTIIAVPALVYSTGAAGFFALPYCTLVYPFVFATMPRLWSVCRKHNLLTAADFVRLRYGSRNLSIAVALTGVLALLPYIALQLVGLEAVLTQMGLTPQNPWLREVPLVLGCTVLAAYTYAAGLRAPALIAFAKDGMIYVVVIAVVVAFSRHIGGYGGMFRGAEAVFTAAHGSGSVILARPQYSAYASLALGSALAAFLYPHTLTGVLASGSGRVIRRNAYLLPAYTLLLGMIALLGLGALSMGIHVENSKQVVPALLEKLFPGWFVGFCYASIAIAALMPAAMMSIAAANLLTRNFYLEYVSRKASDRQQAQFAKRASVAMTMGALIFTLFLPTHYAIDLQLLAGVWVLQTLPAIIFGLWWRWFDSRALLVAWFVGIVTGTWLAVQHGAVVSTTVLHVAGGAYPVFIGVCALTVNMVLASTLTLILHGLSPERAPHVIQPADFCVE